MRGSDDPACARQLYQRSPGLRYVPISATQIAFSAATTHLLALVNAESSNQQKKAAELRETTTACGRILREMGKAYECAHATADIFEGLVEKWAGPPQSSTDTTRDGAVDASHSSQPQPSSLSAVQALDPHSDLAKELLRLGWTPPTAAASAGESASLVRLFVIVSLSTSTDKPRARRPCHSRLSCPPLPRVNRSTHSPLTTRPNFSHTLRRLGASRRLVPPTPLFPTSGPPASTAGLPTWPPFLMPTPAGSSFSAPQAQQYPLADDVLASLLSSEGRAASDETSGSFFGPAHVFPLVGLEPFWQRRLLAAWVVRLWIKRHLRSKAAAVGILSASQRKAPVYACRTHAPLLSRHFHCSGLCPRL